MNTPNPLIPQGALPKQGKTRSTVQVVVVSIIAVHVVFFGGLLLQGCKREKGGELAAGPTNAPLTLPPETNTSPYYAAATNTPAPETAVNTNPAPAPVSSLVSTPEPLPPSNVMPQGATGETKEYAIVKGDTLSKIAKAHGTTVGAISKANPKLDPAKLKIGQKIMIPAGAPAASTGPAAAAGGATAEGGAGTHVVKSGETLTKIAHQHGTSVKAIRSANGLKTDRLTVGQKLKVPAGKGAESAKVAPAIGNTPAAVTNQ
jgi:LysM repeat protein